MNRILLDILCFIGYAGLNIIWAWYHNRLRQAKKSIKHGLWAVAYLACVTPSWFIAHDLRYVAAILLQHAWLFSPALNEFGGFYLFRLSSTSTSLFDSTLLKIGLKDIELVTILTLVASILLIILTLI